MANLKVNNYHNLKLKINKDEYWDFFVNKDTYGSFKIPNGLYEECLISYIDLSDENCLGEDNWIYSKNDYTWDGSLSIGYTLHNIGYTGLDNGLFTYNKNEITREEFFDLLRNNSLELEENDKRLKLHAVSGNTLLYEYPLHIEDGYAKLNGGFFQGFFKTECDKYQVLPSHFENGDTINFEFTIKKCDLEKESDKTLNDKYPENKGLFFYIGTRAENKWIYLYDKEDKDGLEKTSITNIEGNETISNFYNSIQVNDNNEFDENYIFNNGEFMSLEENIDYNERDIDISDFEFETDNGFNLAEANQYYFYTDNKFLFFDRTKTGKTVSNWIDGTQFMFTGRKSEFDGNLFILMNRTKTGYTVNTIDSLRNELANDYNPYDDLYNNALAFRITDKGEIGYRMLVKDCDKEGNDKTSIIEGYSFENIIPDCEWCTINVRMTFLANKMKLFFYVNGKLKYVTKELPPINLRELNDLYEKQEGVPYNISIGGGTQGLSETILYDYMMNPTRVYPLEKYFSGTFIGYISSFKIYNCIMEQMILEHNYKFENVKF